MKLDHVGIAVTSIEEAARLYAEGLGLERLALEEVSEQGVRILKLDAGNTHLELLEPLAAGEGPIAKFLDKRGPGIHHICLAVEDIRAAAARLQTLGFRALSEEPQPGADGCEVMFLHPKDTHGTLIELSQPPRDATQ